MRTTITRTMGLGVAVGTLALAPGIAPAQVPLVTQPLVREATDDRPLRVCAGGDVTLGTNLDTTWVTRAGRGVRALPDPARLVAPLRPLLSDADVVLLNVEGAIGEGAVSRQKCRAGSTNCYAFRQPVAAAAALRSTGGEHAAVVGNVANNHARDAGWDGLRETARLLERAGVAVTGLDTAATIVVTPRGDSVAVLGYSTSGGPDPRDLDAVRRQVAAARAIVPRVVVTMHMGAEGSRAQRTPNETEMFLGIDRGNMVAFARAAVEAGAAFVVGHGPHVMRGAEWWQGALIGYSLGNLLTYGPFSLGEPMNRGGLLCADLDGDGRVVDAVLRSTRQRRPGFVSRDPTHRAAILADSLSALDFPDTGARFRTETRVLPPASRPR